MAASERYDEFAQQIELSTGRILSYLHALLLDWNDAEDVFQETCLVLWQKFDEFQPGTSFLAWALRVAQRKALNFRKKQARRAVFNAGVSDALMLEIAGRSETTTTAGLAALSGCMDKLAQNDQRIVKLRYIEQIPIRQLADAMGRSPESVHNSLHRIRSGLLDCIRREINRADVPSPIRGVLGEEEVR
jgi:RNA polymerase sigma-70 factor (ECF subfamily)